MAFPLPETITAGVTTGHAADHIDIHKRLNSPTDINSQSGTTYTLVLTDLEKFLESTSATATSWTVPPNSSVIFPVGTEIPWAQIGAGQITFVQGSGVTILTSSSLTSRAQNSQGVLRKRSTDGWIISGDLA